VLDLGRQPEARFTHRARIFVTKDYILARYRDYTQQNASVNLVMKIELVLNEHHRISVVFEIVNFDKH
jgi:hypothetical protein